MVVTGSGNGGKVGTNSWWMRRMRRMKIRSSGLFRLTRMSGCLRRFDRTSLWTWPAPNVPNGVWRKNIDFHQISKLQNKFVISAHFILQLSISRRPQGMKLPCSQQYRTGGHWSHISIINWYRNFRNLHRNTVYEDDLLKFCAVLRGFLNMLGSGRFGSLSPPRRA